MFDIGWTEMAIIVLVALIVIGPKDLPRALRTVGHWVRKARSLTREFQSGLDEMMREAELDEARKAIESARNLDLDRVVEQEIDPTGEINRQVRETGEAARRATSGGAGEAERAETAERPAEPKGAEVISHPLKVAPPHSLGEVEQSASTKAPGETAAETPVETGQRGKTGS